MLPIKLINLALMFILKYFQTMHRMRIVTNAPIAKLKKTWRSLATVMSSSLEMTQVSFMFSTI